MAITKIHAIKSTLGKAIAYICNEQKTDSKVLISSFGCAPETADLEFRFLLSNNKEGGPNLAYHLIQSFAPGEVTGEEAHRISQELADRFLQGKYQFVLTTHIDKDHVHSHIIFCAVNKENNKKYHGCTQNYYKIRSISDKLCAEHGKSVIKEFKDTGKTYHEWYHERKGDSWKSQIKKDINECVRKAKTYEEFIRLMKDKNYEINGETFGEGSAKYISFRPFGKDRFVRGRASTLGPEYTKERIRERIEEKVTTLIDTSGEKFKNSIALTKWAKKENLKRTATMYAELGNQNLQSKTARENRLKELCEQIALEKKTLNNLGKECSQFQAIIRHAKYYIENQKYDTAYENSKDKDRYYRTHCDQLESYWNAKHWLENAGIDTDTINLKQLEEHYQKLIYDKAALTESCQAKEHELKQLNNMIKSLNIILDKPNQDRPIHERNDDRNSLR